VKGVVRIGGTVFAGAAMVALAFGLDDGALPMYTRMGLAAIVAVGLSLLMGFAGQISLGQGAFTRSAPTRPGSSRSGSTPTTA
jgi:branched-chain amino acid transport system permease protein